MTINAGHTTERTGSIYAESSSGSSRTHDSPRSLRFFSKGEAMPPIDYSHLAYRRDLDALNDKIQGRFAQIEGAIAETRGELKADVASNLHKVIAAQITTMMMLGAWVAAIT